VDDDLDAGEALADLLAYRGYAVASARNGVEALKHLAVRPLPDVLILDLSMPFMNGWELMSELGKSRELAEIPVIVVSALAPAQCVTAQAIMSKPLDVEALLGVIATLVSASPVQ
jgi:CheY-like chemotaxis protein